MTTNDFSDEKLPLLDQLFDPTTKGVDMFWTIMTLLVVFLIILLY